MIIYSLGNTKVRSYDTFNCFTITFVESLKYLEPTIDSYLKFDIRLQLLKNSNLFH